MFLFIIHYLLLFIIIIYYIIKSISISVSCFSFVLKRFFLLSRIFFMMLRLVLIVN